MRPHAVPFALLGVLAAGTLAGIGLGLSEAPTLVFGQPVPAVGAPTHVSTPLEGAVVGSTTTCTTVPLASNVVEWSCTVAGAGPTTASPATPAS